MVKTKQISGYSKKLQRTIEKRRQHKTVSKELKLAIEKELKRPACSTMDAIFQIY